MQRNSREDDRCADKRVSRLIGEAEYQQNNCREDEERRDEGVAGDAVGARRIGLAVAKHEDSGRGEGVKEPLGKNCERKERLEAADRQQ